MANTTFNPSDIANCTLSGGNLTVNWTAAQGGSRSVHTLVGGKNYWEYTTNTINGADSGVGIANNSAVLTTMGNAPANASFVYKSGTIWVNNAYTGSTLGALANGTVIGVALDMSRRLIWYRVAPAGSWNGSGTADPVAGTGGISISSIAASGIIRAAVSLVGTSDVLSANFGDSGFTGSRPTGFDAGFPAITYPMATQVASEQWINARADARATIVVLEHWGPAGTSQPQAVATLVALEQWMTAGAPVTPQARAWILA